mmetsp:Transcript_41771/g.94224  ORF Transcript_41771/g.94224 Transcript_41771/m.94224 type:complete len:448 (-) Transcript_41771:622-1965(-)
MDTVLGTALCDEGLGEALDNFGDLGATASVSFSSSNGPARPPPQLQACGLLSKAERTSASASRPRPTASLSEACAKSPRPAASERELFARSLKPQEGTSRPPPLVPSLEPPEARLQDAPAITVAASSLPRATAAAASFPRAKASAKSALPRSTTSDKAAPLAPPPAASPAPPLLSAATGGVGARPPKAISSKSAIRLLLAATPDAAVATMSDLLSRSSAQASLGGDSVSGNNPWGPALAVATSKMGALGQSPRGATSGNSLCAKTSAQASRLLAAASRPLAAASASKPRPLDAASARRPSEPCSISVRKSRPLDAASARKPSGLCSSWPRRTASARKSRPLAAASARSPSALCSSWPRRTTSRTSCTALSALQIPSFKAFVNCLTVEAATGLRMASAKLPATPATAASKGPLKILTTRSTLVCSKRRATPSGSTRLSTSRSCLARTC